MKFTIQIQEFPKLVNSEIKAELDKSVAHAYGWSDLELDHNFFELSC